MFSSVASWCVDALARYLWLKLVFALGALVMMFAGLEAFGLSPFEFGGWMSHPLVGVGALVLGATLGTMVLSAARSARAPIGDFTAREALAYLVEESAWGCEQLWELKYFPAVYVSRGREELENLAKVGLINFRGTIGFSPEYIPLDKDYWQSAQIDPMSVLSPGSSPGRTEATSVLQQVREVENLLVPKSELLSARPRANPIFKCLVVAAVRIQWWRSTGKWHGEGA